MQKPNVYIFDIDGTLADHHGVRGPFDESKVEFDKPIYPVFGVLNALSLRYKIIFVSGRTEGCKAETIQWLSTYSNIPEKDIEIYMRKVGDNRKDCIVKKEIYDEFVLPNYNINGVFDDRLQVCRMLYENKIFCFNVNQGLIEF